MTQLKFTINDTLFSLTVSEKARACAQLMQISSDIEIIEFYEDQILTRKSCYEPLEWLQSLYNDHFEQIIAADCRYFLQEAYHEHEMTPHDLKKAVEVLRALDLLKDAALPQVTPKILEQLRLQR